MIETKWHRHSDGSITVQRIQDAEPIIENNKRLQNEGRQTGEFRHIASIPSVIIEKWMNGNGGASALPAEA